MYSVEGNRFYNNSLIKKQNVFSIKINVNFVSEIRNYDSTLLFFSNDYDHLYNLIRFKMHKFVLIEKFGKIPHKNLNHMSFNIQNNSIEIFYFTNVNIDEIIMNNGNNYYLVGGQI